MMNRLFALVAFVFFFLAACTQEGDEDSHIPMTKTSFAAAFTDLDHVDVYDTEGNYLQTIDGDIDFEKDLGFGHYLMDFVNVVGNHSFMDDGRLAFAPMGDGFLPEDGPVFVDGLPAPLWDVEVHPVLEANANLTDRIQNGDEKLRPWKFHFVNWQFNLPEEERDPIDNDSWTAEGKTTTYSYSTTTGSSTARLAVTWQLSYAMIGSSSSACTSGTSCWSLSSATLSTSTSASAYGIGPGYITGSSSARNAWVTAVGSYGATSGYSSCRDNTAIYSVTCFPTVGSASGGSADTTYWAYRFDCQNSTARSSCYGPYTAHGGECKFFQNLVTYMAGLSRDSRGSFRSTPSNSSSSGYALESASTIAVGDVLRRTDSSAHSTIVVAVGYASTATTTPAYALVVDSNWVGSTGGYNEYIGAHIFSMSTLAAYYHNISCVYDGTC